MDAPLTRHLLRARDLIDTAYAEPLDIPALARAATVSPSHFSRRFKAAFGETPHRYLLTRRMERAKTLLRAGRTSVTEVCLAVGFTSLGSFSTQFRRFVGESPSAYRARAHPGYGPVPGCFVRAMSRPREEQFWRSPGAPGLATVTA
ncbi:helix-turn-helix domain-containing protein [Crossiella sp. NPDC003009]